MARIHPSAIVSSHAELGTDVTIGPYSIIDGNTIIGNGTQIGAHVSINSGTRLGSECRVFNGAVVGSIPQDLKFHGEDSTLEIGDRTTIREFATLNRGTADAGTTRIGSDCLLMAYVHVAHDCIIGANVILSNAVNLAGHVIIEDWVGVGGMTPVHQFVRIGSHAFIGGGYRVPKDVPPFILASGEPLTYAGLNKVGLQRRGFEPDQLRRIKKAYKLIFRSKLNVSQSLEIVKQEFADSPEVGRIIQFVEDSDRGIIR